MSRWFVGITVWFVAIFGLQAQPELTWAINVSPPFHIVDGPLKDQGLCDALIRSVGRQMPGYNQQLSLMPQPRIHQWLNNDQQLCFPCMIYRSEPSETAVFSQPTHSYPPQGILTRKAVAELMVQEFGQPVALSTVLKSDRFKLGLAAGRRYGEIQPLLDTYQHQHWSRSGESGTVAILKMIQSGRLDYSLDYPMALTYLSLTEPDIANGLVYLPIAELTKPVAGAIGCANSDWGKQQISKLNKILDKVQQDPDFIRAKKLWLQSSVATLPQPAR